MTIPNHVIAGACIVLYVNERVIALVVALLSHFAMDALPHFGYKGNMGFGEALKHRLSYWVGYISAIITVVLIGFLLLNQLWLALSGAVLATMPDLAGIYNYLCYEKYSKKAGRFITSFHINFHRAIQKYERPWGIYIEIITFIVLFIILLNLLSAE